MHAGRRADFFCGVYQLETRFARINVFVLPGDNVSSKIYTRDVAPGGVHRGYHGTLCLEGRAQRIVSRYFCGSKSGAAAGRQEAQPVIILVVQSAVNSRHSIRNSTCCKTKRSLPINASPYYYHLVNEAYPKESSRRRPSCLALWHTLGEGVFDLYQLLFFIVSV